MAGVFHRCRLVLAIAAFILGVNSASFADIVFVQTNLTSDIPGLAAVTDPNLKNPWGVSFSPTSPFWVSDQGTSVSTLYNASGVPQPASPLIVSTPGGPTGQVFNSTSGFQVGGSPAAFIFSTLSGNIEAWNSSQGATAAIMHTTPGGSYTGLTLAANQLYAANKATGKIDVFDSSFNPVSLGSSAFVDAAAPVGLTPYDIQVIDGKLYVEYSGARGAPGGFVAVFDVNGNLLQNIGDSHLNAPWGITMAPLTFPGFGGDLLIGNFNDGMINAFDPSSGAFLGTLMDSPGHAIANPGLWALKFRDTSSPNANTGSDPNALFFVAGINHEADGLFGKITVAPVPEPASIQLLGILLLAGVSSKLLRRVV
jgi:uncharacterized protein (TIGR03118 family)